MSMQHDCSVMWHLLSRHWPNPVHLIRHWMSICVPHQLSNSEHTVLFGLKATFSRKEVGTDMIRVGPHGKLGAPPLAHR